MSAQVLVFALVLSSASLDAAKSRATTTTKNELSLRAIATRALQNLRGKSSKSSSTKTSSSMRGGSRRRLDIPANTYWGTTECKHWPLFHLQDYQPESGADYLESYGLGDMLPLADVTIVGLYFADSEECRTQAIRQNDLVKDINAVDKDIVVHNVMINYYMPLSCLTKECVPSWYNTPFFMPWYTDQCYGYVGGCASTDASLTVENWQTPLSNVTSIPMFQDTEWDNIWDDFGGGKGDLFIYDGIGRLYSYISQTPGSSGFPAISAPLTNDTTYEFVKTQALAAAKSNGTEKCKTFKDDDNPNPINYDDVFYYYYYYENADDDDDKASKKKKGDDDDDDDDDKDDDDKAAAAAQGTADAAATEEEDDGWRPGLHGVGDDDGDDDDDAFYKNKHTKKTYKGYGTEKNKGIPSYILASLIAVLAFAVSAGIFWLRRRYLQATNMTAGSFYAQGGATHNFMKLPTAEGVNGVPDNQLEVEMRAPGWSPTRGSKDDGSYGSL